LPEGSDESAERAGCGAVAKIRAGGVDGVRGECEGEYYAFAEIDMSVLDAAWKWTRFVLRKQTVAFHIEIH